MARSGKKQPHAFVTLPTRDAEGLIREIAEALKTGERTELVRREMVESLVAEEYKRGTIVRIIGQMFNAKPRTVDRDIEWVKGKWLEERRDRRSEDLRAKSEERMQKVIQRGFSKGDLPSVVAAAKHLDVVSGVIKREDEVAPINLGVVVLPGGLTIDEWKKQSQKSLKGR